MEKAEILNLKGRASFDSGLVKIIFIGFYAITQILGLCLILIVFGILVYQNVLPSIQKDPTQVAEVAGNSLSTTEVNQPVLQPTESDPVVLTTISAVVVQTEEPQLTQENINPTPAILDPTATAIPVSISMIDQDICSPISGVEINELASIISQPYNVPNMFSDDGHHGVDFGSYDFNGSGLLGYPIQAVFNGRVAGITVNRPPIGNAIIIETPYDSLPESLRTVLGINSQQSLYHMYAHMINAPAFAIGDAITCGEEIGNLGNSQTAEAHLHFETVIGLSNQIIPGMAFYSADATQEEMDAYLLLRTSGIFMPFDPMSLFANFR
jgi:murein DD-endopeptidase MepM/ murein hydrolase activator NlpD